MEHTVGSIKITSKRFNLKWCEGGTWPLGPPFLLNQGSIWFESTKPILAVFLSVDKECKWAAWEKREREGEREKNKQRRKEKKKGRKQIMAESLLEQVFIMQGWETPWMSVKGLSLPGEVVCHVLRSYFSGSNAEEDLCALCKGKLTEVAREQCASCSLSWPHPGNHAALRWVWPHPMRTASFSHRAVLGEALPSPALCDAWSLPGFLHKRSGFGLWSSPSPSNIYLPFLREGATWLVWALGHWLD